MQVIWTSVFADGPGGGNPCPVVLGADTWTTDRMQQLAASFGFETAFALPSEAGADVRLRYFVPLHEMEMCVHATVAATVLLGRDGQLPRNPARVETPLGVIDVEWDVDTSTALVHQFPPEFGPELAPYERHRVLAALRLQDADLAADVGPVQSVSTARAKLMVPVRDEAVLDGMTPDFDLLWTVCDELGVTGFYPFTLHARDADVAARQFPRRAGYDEDPATGVAAAALGAYLAVRAAALPSGQWRGWRIAQGRAMGRPSVLTAEAFLGDSAGGGTVTATRVGGRMQEAAGPADI
jgi:trans-2,3-dihydro-3-hydroxyanthranilate isomerase